MDGVAGVSSRAAVRRLVHMAVVAAVVCILCCCSCRAAEAGKARRVKKTLLKGRGKGAGGGQRPAEGGVKLLGGGGPAKGAVLVYHSSRWGAVCDDELWGLQDAHVVCRQLGFPGAARPAFKGEFRRGKQRVWISQVQCRGHEARLIDCPFTGWDAPATAGCPADSRAAGVVCQKRVRPPVKSPKTNTNTTTTTTTTISTPTSGSALSDTSLPYALGLTDSEEGYLSVLEKRITAEASSTGDETTAKVPPSPLPLVSDTATQPPLPHRVVSSSASEGLNAVSSADAVALTEPNTKQTATTTTVTTTSYTTTTTEAPTMTASTSRSPTVQTITPNSSASAPKTQSENTIAMPAAASAGQTAAETTVPATTLPLALTNTTKMADAGPKLTDKVVDLKRGKVLGDVKLTGGNIPVEDATLLQADSPGHPELELRLANGRYRNEGLLEVREIRRPEDGKNGWYTVCGQSWSMRETMVVCRQMDMHYAKQALQTNYFGGEHLVKKYFSFKCTGHEAKLSECQATPISNDNQCKKPTSVAGVICALYLPDLVPNLRALQESVMLQNRPLYYLQCALEESCLSSSAYVIRNTSKNWMSASRKLLRFSTVVYNNGNADFRPILARGQWEWHACHMHYHSMEVFAHYDIVTSNGTRLAEGSKASFCLEDTFCDKGIHPKFDCDGYGEQGLSVNCSDSYNWDIDCQWIDVTDIQPGIYTFLVEVNPDFLVAELSFDNNVARCDLWYSSYAAHLSNCRLESLLDYRRSWR